MKKKNWWLILIIAVIVIAAIIVFISIRNKDNSAAVNDYYLNVHFIDVGQGDSTLIVTPDEYILIDAGTDSSEVKLVSYLDKLGVDTLDYLIISHPHSDHIGGADAIMRSFDVECIVQNGLDDGKYYVENLTEAAEQDGTELEVWAAGDTFEIGGIEFYVIAPIDETNDDVNNSSLVIKMVYGDSSFLFTGDAERQSELAMLDTYGEEMLDCDVLKVGHHGSSTSSCDEFIAAVSPALSVISCELGNRYGHPHIETLQTLEYENSMIWRIDLDGSVVVSTDGRDIVITDTIK